MTPTAAYYDPTTGALAIVFDGELTESDDISTAGFSAVLPTGYRAVFSAAGETANDGGVGRLTFVVQEGAASDAEPILYYRPDQSFPGRSPASRLARLARLGR